MKVNYLIVLILVINGCRALSPQPVATEAASKKSNYTTSQPALIADVQTQQEQQTQDTQSAVGVVNKQVAKNIVNDVMPWIIGGVATVAIFFTAICVIILVWIKQNSYMNQKPKWEQLKQITAKN